ncbi:MAG: hypothetical protein LKI92_04795 [Schleiferilactobacillus harbinensis]|jgi:hypothetical protein|nr:hypothetical protein [Schleiferilactobacillus harbinensis]MCI1912539.1 hypothetical protein [Schleiferilactobacillus harbinensis]
MIKLNQTYFLQEALLFTIGCGGLFWSQLIYRFQMAPWLTWLMRVFGTFMVILGTLQLPVTSLRWQSAIAAVVIIIPTFIGQYVDRRKP